MVLPDQNGYGSVVGVAAAIGGGLEERPRHSRIFRIAMGGWIAQSTRMRPPNFVRIHNAIRIQYALNLVHDLDRSWIERFRQQSFLFQSDSMFSGKSAAEFKRTPLSMFT